jgi:hypothetical protein
MQFPPAWDELQNIHFVEVSQRADLRGESQIAARPLGGFRRGRRGPATQYRAARDIIETVSSCIAHQTHAQRAQVHNRETQDAPRFHGYDSENCASSLGCAQLDRQRARCATNEDVRSGSIASISLRLP